MGEVDQNQNGIIETEEFLQVISTDYISIAYLYICILFLLFHIIVNECN